MDDVLPQNLSYEELEGKRKLQLSELTRITSSLNQIKIEKVTLSTAESFMKKLQKNELKHNAIIEAMYSCPTAVEATVSKYSEKFYNDFSPIEQRVSIILEAKRPTRMQLLIVQLEELEFHLKAYEKIRNEDCGEENECSLRSIINGIEPTKSKFNEIFSQIRREQMSKEETTAIESRYFDFLKSYNSTLGYFQENLKHLCSSQINSSQEKINEERPFDKQSQSPFATAKIKLPPIELPKFDGAPESWTSYRDTFKSIVHSNEALTGAVKFHYLKSSITDKMSPISFLKETDDGYADAWQAVLDFYDDERKIVEKHLSSLLTAKRMTCENHDELQRLLNDFNNHTAGLERLIPKENLYETFIAHLINHRLDPATRNLFETENTEKIPQWSNVKKFLEKRRKTLSTISSSKVGNRFSDVQRSQSYFMNNKTPFRSATAHTAHAETIADVNQLMHVDQVNVNATHIGSYASMKSKCLICHNRDHKLSQCSLYLALDATQRFMKVKELGLCTNCLGFHSFVQCKNPNTCRTCQKKHHTSLHKESLEVNKQAMLSHLQNLQNTDETYNETLSQSFSPLDPNVQSFRNVNSTCSLSKHGNEPIIFLSTAIIKIKDKDGQWHEARALLDSGADANFITTRIANVLNLPKIPTIIQTNGFGGTTNLINAKVNAQISSRLGWFNKEMEFFVTQKITGMTPSAPLNPSKLEIPSTIELADPTFGKPGPIDLLIGNEFFMKLILNERIELSSGPILQETVFGFIVAGKLTNERKITTFNCNLITHSELRESIEKFYKDEDYRTNKQFLSEEEAYCESFFERTHERTLDGRFIVEIPLKDNVNELCNNKNQAYSQFIANEKRLAKNIRLREETIKFMREYEALGHMTEICPSTDENPQAYYLPHHAVEKPDSTTTKVRIVFNASARTKSGLSFNDVQFNGPTVQKDSFSLNLKFRLHNIVIKADIEKMYRQILVKPDQRKYQRILWREAPHLRMKIYELNTITYGTKSGSFNATRCLKQLAIENRDIYPQAAEEIENSFYVDDLLSGSDTTQNAIKLFKDIDKIITSSRMKLKKLASNCSKFISSIPLEDRETSRASDATVKALGIKWNPETDHLEFDIKPMQYTKITKRVVLSEIAKLYDPEGLLGPVVFKFKQFMKTVYDLKISWDTPLPDNETSAWVEIASTFPQIQKIRINRQFTLSSYISIQLHGFCDASEQGYGAVIYVRTEDSNGIRMSAIICAKSRIAPSASKTIARLELSGGVILIHLITKVTEALNINFDKIFCWTDSSIVLHWLKKTPSLLQTYVANRVSEIQEMTKKQDMTWRHIRGELNPADLISRGLMPEEIVDNDMWWNGPSFLKQIEQSWPSSLITIDQDDPSYRLEFKRVLNANPLSCSHSSPQNPFIEMIEDSSRIFRIKWKLAHIVRFLYNIKAPKLGHQKRSGSITVEDLQDAEILLARIHQQCYFPNEFQKLSESKVISTSSHIKNLDPFWDPHNRVIRVGGRLKHAKHITENHKHPIILPKCHFASLIVREVHQHNMHTGQQATLGILKTKYWPIRARAIVRRECHKCVKCFRTLPRMVKQFMGQLPEPRITPAPVFYHTGIDYAGPIIIKSGYTRNAKAMKAYIALFICLATKAIHLEIVSELTTKAFLAALDRFISRRGLSCHIYSDNGTNFVGAKKELKDLTEFLQATSNQLEISQHLLKQEISWHFIPPNSPEQGGLWEAGVKSMKYHLQKVVGEAHLHYEELQTITCKIEAILNSRPIIPISNDPNDVEVLTNGHILIGRPLLAAPQRDVSQIPIQRLQRWDRILHIQQTFWRRWTNDYLHQLQTRTKNYKTQTPIAVGQIVLMQMDNAPTLNWPLGKITEIFPGKDGITRIARVRTANSVYERAVNKLAILPIDDNENFPSRQDVN